MNNFIDYFYNIKVEKIIFNNKYYSFYYNGYLYNMYLIQSNVNVNSMININRKLLGHTLVSEIIINKDGNYISYYNNQNYMLIKIYVNINKNISLEEINYLANSLKSEKNKVDWGILWSNKIDYLEDLINENGKKYPILVDSFNYFVGMAENGISYYNNINIDKNYSYVISHKIIRFNDTILALYNPLNIIFDYKARDIAEYIKNAFFLNNKNIYNELYNYMQYSNLLTTDVMLIVARILYPSFYFEMYEDILVDNQSEKIIVPIIDRLPEYEIYLASIISFFKNYYDIPEINWLNKIHSQKKEDINLH